MRQNMGGLDRALRAATGLILALAGYVLLTGGGSIVAFVIAAVFGVTALLGFCPLYTPLHVDTRRHE